MEIRPLDHSSCRHVTESSGRSLDFVAWALAIVVVTPSCHELCSNLRKVSLVYRCSINRKQTCNTGAERTLLSALVLRVARNLRFPTFHHEMQAPHLAPEAHSSSTHAAQVLLYPLHPKKAERILLHKQGQQSACSRHLNPIGILCIKRLACCVDSLDRFHGINSSFVLEGQSDLG